jgi:stearoyl-CoA 9-desaturase NADPH oxidoreductase
MASTTIPWKRLRTAANKLTTPLHPDDYLRLINPLWSERELRGRVEEVISETDDAATLVIRPGWGWHYNHRPGQYVGIGVQVDGKFQWRSYSVSSPPQRKGRNISITVKAMPEGLLSSHLVKGLAPGTIVRLALPRATSCCRTRRRSGCSSWWAAAESPR